MDSTGRTQDPLTAERRLELLTAAAKSTLTTLELGALLPKILDLARESLTADAYAIWRAAPGEHWRLLAQAGLSDWYVETIIPRISRAETLPREPLVFEDPDHAELLRPIRDAQRKEGIQALLTVPLFLHGEPCGALAFYFRSKRTFSRADVDAASLAAMLASSAIGNAELYEAKTRQEARYRFLADNAHDVITRISADGMFIDVSPAVQRVLGHAPQDLIGTRVADILHPDDLTRFRASDAPRIEGTIHHVRYRHRDGRWIDMEAVARIVRTQDDRIAEYVTSLRDISMRKAHERDLHLHARVIGSMAEGVSLITTGGLVVYTNPAEDRMFGAKAGELLGRPLFAQTGMSPQEGLRLLESIAGRVKERGHWEGELENVRRDGTRFVTRARITGVELDGALHWVRVQEDITHRLALESRELARARTLKTLQRVQTDLASGLDVERIVQIATDAATSLTGASFGAFFYNITDNKGERYTLYTLSGVPREAFAKFPMPRNTALFGPTFRGEGVLRIDDVLEDARYGKNAPYKGMPAGHLPVRSYLAVPVMSRDGSVHGGLFFGHPDPGRFSLESEEVATAIAAQTSVALDNAHLYRRAKDNEEMIRDREAQLAQAQAIAHLGSWRTAFEDDALEWSDENARIHGMAPGQSVDLAVFYETIHPADRGHVRTCLDRLRREPEVTFEYRIILPGGEIRHAQARGRCVRDERGDPIEAVGTTLDITERKLTERALQESEDRFRTLVTATTQMVWYTDADGLIIDMPEWREFTGQTIEEIRGRGWIDAVHPEDRDRLVKTWTAAFDARVPYECEYRVRGADGQYRHFHARAVPRYGRDGELIEYIGTWTDATDRKQSIEEAQSLRVQLIHGEKLAALGQLVSGVAHELRTPLTFLNNNAFLLRQRIERAAQRGADAGEMAAAAKTYLDEITAGVDRINALVSDLRRYTRARSDTSIVQGRLDDVALDAVELFRAANRGTHHVQTTFSATRSVNMNVGAVQQLLLNLLQNAADASPAGRPVRVRTRDGEGSVILEVVDEGAGIPESVQARMFEPLFTTKADGTGLGLSIVRRIVDEHKAAITCESRPGQGTTFRIEFPDASGGTS